MTLKKALIVAAWLECNAVDHINEVSSRTGTCDSVEVQLVM